MSYVKADLILPREILILVQEYADGQYLYIPKRADNRKSWGDNTNSKQQINERDHEIYRKFKSGANTQDLAGEYYLSPKSIQRIILKGKNNNL